MKSVDGITATTRSSDVVIRLSSCSLEIEISRMITQRIPPSRLFSSSSESPEAEITESRPQRASVRRGATVRPYGSTGTGTLRTCTVGACNNPETPLP